MKTSKKKQQRTINKLLGKIKNIYKVMYMSAIVKTVTIPKE